MLVRFFTKSSSKVFFKVVIFSTGSLGFLQGRKDFFSRLLDFLLGHQVFYKVVRYSRKLSDILSGNQVFQNTVRSSTWSSDFLKVRQRFA